MNVPDSAICPYCAGSGRYLPYHHRYRTLPCPRCKETGQVDAAAEERRQRANNLLCSQTLPTLAQRYGVSEHLFVDWSTGRMEIPAEVQL